MQRYVARRLLLMLPTLLGVTFVVFAMVRAVPSDVVDRLGGEFGDQSAKEALRKELQLDGDVAAQYVRWLGDVVRLDFGDSLLSGRPVAGDLRSRLPVTLELSVLGIVFALLISVPVGVISAVRQDTWVDYLARSLAIGFLAVPGFWLATVIVTVTAGEPALRWAVPPRSYIAIEDNPIGNPRMMSLPALILGFGLSGGVMRLTRSAMLEVLRQDYIRTAWSKGLQHRVIIIRHALRNALIPVVTAVGLQLPILVGGTVLIEQVYSIPGMGRLYLNAINQLDYPTVQAINVIVACVVVFANLGVDLLYSSLDPRIRYS